MQFIQIWQNLATTLKIFGHFQWVQLVSAKVLSLLWLISNAIGQILLAEKGKILKNNLAVWSHWLHAKMLYSIGPLRLKSSKV